VHEYVAGIAARLRHGTVWINDYNTYLPQAEWGGYKQSGLGREWGAFGFEEFLETKSVFGAAPSA